MRWLRSASFALMFAVLFTTQKIHLTTIKHSFYQVNVSLNLRNIFEVNEKAQYITLETSIRMFWRDPRLTSMPVEGRDFVTINGHDIRHFWVPDIFIDQAIKLREPTFEVKPASLRVYPDGLLR